MKKILFIFIVLLFGCTKVDIPAPEPPIEKIFNVTESTVTNDQSIYFDLPSNGIYMLTLIEKETGQVVSREKFVGQSGENIKKIYTKSLQAGYLYLVLEDADRNQLNKTIIIVK